MNVMARLVASVAHIGSWRRADRKSWLHIAAYTVHTKLQSNHMYISVLNLPVHISATFYYSFDQISNCCN